MANEMVSRVSAFTPALINRVAVKRYGSRSSLQGSSSSLALKNRGGWDNGEE